MVRRRGYGVRVRGRVFQKNTKQLLKQKEVFTWPHVLRDLRVKTGPDERGREVRTRHIIYICNMGQFPCCSSVSADIWLSASRLKALWSPSKLNGRLVWRAVRGFSMRKHTEHDLEVLASSAAPFVCKKISRRSEQRRAAGAKDRRRSSAEARLQRGAQRRPARRAPREAFADGSKAKVRGARQSALGAFPPPIKKWDLGIEPRHVLHTRMFVERNSAGTIVTPTPTPCQSHISPGHIRSLVRPCAPRCPGSRYFLWR